jgi:membrane protein implicated in regulation of membrane protease activity
MKAKRVASRIALGVISFLLVLSILGAIVMLLWNALIPDLFGGPAVGYWQSVGLLLLSHILLGGARLRRFGRWRRHPYRNRKDRMDAMTSEQRAGPEQRHERNTGRDSPSAD